MDTGVVQPLGQQVGNQDMHGSSGNGELERACISEHTCIYASGNIHVNELIIAAKVNKIIHHLAGTALVGDAYAIIPNVFWKKVVIYQYFRLRSVSKGYFQVFSAAEIIKI